MTERPRCIVCGKALPKRIRTYEIRDPQPAVSLSGPFAGKNLPAREDGDRYSSGESGWITLWIARERQPRTKADCERLCNGAITSVSRWADGRVMSFNAWDGESYMGRYFCSNKCAIRQGWAAAEHGHRFTWG